jgi:hypothetical protein
MTEQRPDIDKLWSLNKAVGSLQVKVCVTQKQNRTRAWQP